MTKWHLAMFGALVWAAFGAIFCLLLPPEPGDMSRVVLMLILLLPACAYGGYRMGSWEGMLVAHRDYNKLELYCKFYRVLVFLCGLMLTIAFCCGVASLVLSGESAQIALGGLWLLLRMAAGIVLFGYVIVWYPKEGPNDPA